MKIRSAFRSYSRVLWHTRSAFFNVNSCVQNLGNWKYALSALEWLSDEVPLVKSEIEEIIKKINFLKLKINNEDITLKELRHLLNEIFTETQRLSENEEINMRLAAGAIRNGAEKVIDNQQAIVKELGKAGFDNLEALRILKIFKDSGVKNVWMGQQDSKNP